jgi:hypothetical protein
MEKKSLEMGLTWKGTGDKRMAVAPPVGFVSPLTVFGHQADKVGNVEFIERKGTPLEIKTANAPINPVIESSASEIPRPLAARRISFTEFLKQLRAEIGIITPAMNADLRANYENGIEVKKAEEVIQQIQDGTWQQDVGCIMQSTG